jgi:P27 family predicted phage terminase small subunit
MPKGGTKKSGAKKKPTKLKQLQGTDQPCRTNELEPKPKEISSADCPEWLAGDKVTKDFWDWTIGQLSGSGVLTESDLPSVEMFCIVYSDLRQLKIDMAKAGRVYYVEKMDSNGNITTEPKTSPLATQFNQLLTQYRMFSSMFGFDPSSRPSLSTNPKEKDDNFDF